MQSIHARGLESRYFLAAVATRRRGVCTCDVCFLCALLQDLFFGEMTTIPRSKHRVIHNLALALLLIPHARIEEAVIDLAALVFPIFESDLARMSNCSKAPHFRIISYCYANYVLFQDSTLPCGCFAYHLRVRRGGGATSCNEQGARRVPVSLGQNVT